MLLASENFQENAVVNLKQIWKRQEFTDVTLVSSDGFKLQAHKSVLTSWRSFFRDILIEHQHMSVLLFMRGVTHRELELLSRMIPVKENSKMFGDANKKALPAELKKEISVAPNLSGGGLSINIEVPLDRNPDLDSKMVEDTVEEREQKSDFNKQQIKINMELP